MKGRKDLPFTAPPTKTLHCPQCKKEKLQMGFFFFTCKTNKISKFN